jgi:threonine dehydrogenase-like Zn-dependent dehydrogenase
MRQFWAQGGYWMDSRKLSFQPQIECVLVLDEKVNAEYDVFVVGAGLLGLATAICIKFADPALKVTWLPAWEAP